MTSRGSHRQRARKLTRELRWRPLARRRLLAELTAHLDDSAADLRAAGWPADDASAEAGRRLGDPDTLALALRSARSDGRWKLPGRRLRSLAWIAAGAMSLVTAWAAEVPPASGAKATTSTAQARPGARPGGRKPTRLPAPAAPAGWRR